MSTYTFTITRPGGMPVDAYSREVTQAHHQTMTDAIDWEACEAIREFVASRLHDEDIDLMLCEVTDPEGALVANVWVAEVMQD